MIWNAIIRPLFFALPAEPAHHLAMGMFASGLRLAPLADLFRRRYLVDDPRLRSDVCRLNFRNPVGLAAGFDKHAGWFNQLACLGFSHVEVGTVTGEGQLGNERPRLFRLPGDRAIINRMGFNNPGSRAVAERLSQLASGRNQGDILGINIGKTKVVPIDAATDDYLKSFERLFPYADYFTINVSSPNTPGLRALQDRDHLLELLPAIDQLNSRLSEAASVPARPVFLKIAPDVNESQLDDFAAIVDQTQLSGVIATNTTISRVGLRTEASRVAGIGNGGLSGAPLTEMSRVIVRKLYQRIGQQVPIICVGGIMNGEDAWQMILAGASLIQTYTGFVYGGPTFVRDINRYLLKKLEHHNLTNIQQAIGHQNLSE